MSNWIVVTGGAGYIGSHIVVVLLQHGHKVVIVDNFDNSSPAVIDRIKRVVPKGELAAEQMDMLDGGQVKMLFAKYTIDAVIHLAGLKSVGESVQQPTKYYATNIGIACNLMAAMIGSNVKNIVYSSSASVYGHSAKATPISEQHPTVPLSPYGRSKLFIESIFRDAFDCGHLDKAIVLRYFNPAGAHPSGLIGEAPRGIPNNLMPAIAQCAMGAFPGTKLRIYGGDYDTLDGTGVRDYIHVMDLARAHVQSLLFSSARKRVFDTFNIGTGTGHSVLQMIKAFEAISGKCIEFEVVERRAGDMPVLMASVEKAKSELGFVAAHSLEDMCHDYWHWQKNHPDGI